MSASVTIEDPHEQFAHCVQVFGGIPATSRRLGIDERAIRRFINGEWPICHGLWQDTAQALRQLIAEAKAAERDLGVSIGVQPMGLQTPLRRQPAATAC